LLIKKSNGFIKINKFSYPAIYHILDWSLLIMKTTNFRSVLESGAVTVGIRGFKRRNHKNHKNSKKFSG